MNNNAFVTISFTPGAKCSLKKIASLNVIEGRFLQLLEPYKDKFPAGFKIIVKKSKEYGGTNHGKKKISITSKYLSELMTNSNPEFIGQMILEVIGHEMGHPKAFIGYPFFFLIKGTFPKLFPKERFRCRLVEVYCDHNSLSFTGFTKEIHKKVMEEHIRVKKGAKTDLMHPSWEDRAKYIVKEFDEELIREIASDNRCNSEKEIRNQINYYKKVLENDGYITQLAIFKTVCFGTEMSIIVLGLLFFVFKELFHLF